MVGALLTGSRGQITRRAHIYCNKSPCRLPSIWLDLASQGSTGFSGGILFLRPFSSINVGRLMPTLFASSSSPVYHVQMDWPHLVILSHLSVLLFCPILFFFLSLYLSRMCQFFVVYFFLFIRFLHGQRVFFFFLFFTLCVGPS